MKKFLIVLLMLIGTPALADIALDNAQSYNSGPGGSATTHTLSSFVVATHTDRLLVVVLTHDAGETVDSVTFNAGGLTQLVHIHHATGADSEIWYVKNPTETTGNIVVSHAAFAIDMVFNVYAIYNVEQTTTFRDNDSATGVTATSSGLTLTSSASSGGDWLIDGLSVILGGSDPGNLVPGAGTEGLDAQPWHRGSARRLAATGATVAADWTWTSSATFAHAATTVIPVSDGAATVVLLLSGGSN